MANKLAGQRAKFSRARVILYTETDEARKRRATELMAEVLFEAPANGFAEEEVTQGEDVPDEVRHLLTQMAGTRIGSDASENDQTYIDELADTVDTSDLKQIGSGSEFVYAYSYECTPDRLKIGSCAGDVLARVAAQISTGTPAKPKLLLVLGTHDCRALERAIQYGLRLRGQKVEGAGSEWFIATCEQVIGLYRAVSQG